MKANAYAERFVRSIKSECLNRMIFIGQGSLRRAVVEYMGHYHGERNHQGLDNRLIQAVPTSTRSWDGPPEAETRWNAQLLLPRANVVGVVRIIGHHGMVNCGEYPTCDWSQM